MGDGDCDGACVLSPTSTGTRTDLLSLDCPSTLFFRKSLLKYRVLRQHGAESMGAFVSVGQANTDTFCIIIVTNKFFYA